MAKRIDVQAAFAVYMAAIFVCLFLAAAELILRAQQLYGPIYNLDFEAYAITQPSDILNHVPDANNNLSPYGIHKRYNSLGMREYSSLKQPDICENPRKILFFGDSFMDGYDDAHTIPSLLTEYFAKDGVCMDPYNAGMSSYSPAIFVPQARLLVPKIMPEYVVVDIDETDFFDDNFRYKDLISRDENGNNVGVRASPGAKQMMPEINSIRSSSLFVVRLFKVATGTYAKLLNSVKTDQTVSPIFELSRLSPELAREKFRNELAFFQRNIAELISVFRENNIPSERIVFIRHPHLQHISNEEGPLWNDVIYEAVREVAAKNGVRIYDSKADLRSVFGDHPDKYYFKKDMHFNFEGMKAYSGTVEKFLLGVF